MIDERTEFQCYTVFPDYRTHNKWLKENGHRLLAMLGD